MDLKELPRFACGKDKRPITRNGFYDASIGVDDSDWPLVAIPSGAISGVDCLDIDPEGRSWYDLNYDALPATLAHSTPRGLHLLFRHADGLRCSTGRIAPGIDVKADGGYFIFWPRQGLAFEDNPLCEFPAWLLAEAMGPKRSAPSAKVALPRSPTSMGIDGNGLDALNVRDYRNHDDWLRLMMACHSAGVSREAFIRWSVADPLYAGDGEEIGRRWDSLRRDGGITEWALRVEIRLAQLNKGIHPKHRIDGGAWEAQISTGPINWPEQRHINNRISGLLATAQKSEPLAFWAAATIREELVAAGKLGIGAAVKLLRGVGIDSRVIASGFLRAEDKLKGE